MIKCSSNICVALSSVPRTTQRTERKERENREENEVPLCLCFDNEKEKEQGCEMLVLWHDSHCNHENTAAVVACTGPVQERACHQSDLGWGGTHRALPLCAER